MSVATSLEMKWVSQVHEILIVMFSSPNDLWILMSNMGLLYNQQHAADAQVQLQVSFRKSITEDYSFWNFSTDQLFCIDFVLCFSHCS